MCAINESTRTDNHFKTAYQRAHYFKKVQEIRPIAESEVKIRTRPDLYVYDPIINEKITTYKECYGEAKLNAKASEFYGKIDLSSKYTLKNLYNEYHCKPPKTLKYDETITASHYRDPARSVETKLLQNFCIENSPNVINSSFNEHCHSEFLHPYMSTTHFEYEDFSDTRLHVIAKDDTITYYNGRVKNKVPATQKFSEVKQRVFFKVPFKGDSSTYGEDFKTPAVKSAFLHDVCVLPDFFQAIKT